jgi:hypothetical protein
MEPVLRTRDFRRQTLRPRHRPVVRALAEAFFSEDGEAEAARLDAFVGEVDRYISPASKTLRFGMLLILDILRWLPLFIIARPSAFEELPVADRVRMLKKMEQSRLVPLALIVAAYRTVLTLLFYEDEGEFRGLGYPGAERHRYKRVLRMTGEKEAAVG